MKQAIGAAPNVDEEDKAGCRNCCDASSRHFFAALSSFGLSSSKTCVSPSSSHQDLFRKCTDTCLGGDQQYEVGHRASPFDIPNPGGNLNRPDTSISDAASENEKKKGDDNIKNNSLIDVTDKVESPEFEKHSTTVDLVSKQAASIFVTAEKEQKSKVDGKRDADTDTYLGEDKTVTKHTGQKRWSTKIEKDYRTYAKITETCGAVPAKKRKGSRELAGVGQFDDDSALPQPQEKLSQ